MKRENYTIAIMVAVILVLITIIGIFSVNDKDRNRDDITEDDIPIEEEEEEEEEQFDFTIEDVFFTDRITSLMKPSFSKGWLVMWISFDLNGSKHQDAFVHLFYLETDRNIARGESHPEYINNTMPQECINITRGDEGWIYFEMASYEKPLSISYNGSEIEQKNITKDLSTTDIEYRPWRTPLTIEINDIGRDGPQDPHPEYLYMNITVRNLGENVTHFRAWHMTMNVTGGGVRDVIFVEYEEWVEMDPEEVKRYRLYWDVMREAPEYPEVLISGTDRLYVEIDPALYDGLFDGT